MTKATHNGTCQVCGNQQAYRGVLAKHGYTVDCGYFSGTCRGSDKSPLEHDKAITESTIAGCVAQANKLEAMTITDIKTVPVRVRKSTGQRFGTYLETTQMNEAKYNAHHGDRHYTSFERAAQNHLEFVIYREAKFLREHAALMAAMIDERHGADLISREPAVDRIREEYTERSPAYARQDELKADGWRVRINRGKYRGDPAVLTATRSK